MTISERIFERIKQIDMTQKEFSEKTGIRQSTISEWKKNRTNPSSDKIMGYVKQSRFLQSGSCQESIRRKAGKRIRSIM